MENKRELSEYGKKYESILEKILEGYVPGRFIELKEKLPLTLFEKLSKRKTLLDNFYHLPDHKALEEQYPDHYKLPLDKLSALLEGRLIPKFEVTAEEVREYMMQYITKDIEEKLLIGSYMENTDGIELTCYIGEEGTRITKEGRRLEGFMEIPLKLKEAAKEAFASTPGSSYFSHCCTFYTREEILALHVTYEGFEKICQDSRVFEHSMASTRTFLDLLHEYLVSHIKLE